MRWPWQRKSKVCGAWDPPEGLGRDTHICLLPPRHNGKHKCKCGAAWKGPCRS